MAYEESSLFNPLDIPQERGFTGYRGYTTPSNIGARDFSGTVGSLGYGEEFADTTLADSWQEEFDPYDFTDELELRKRARGRLSNIYQQAAAGTQDLMKSWAGGGQVMSGRKQRQLRGIGDETALATSDIGLGLKSDVKGLRDRWTDEQERAFEFLMRDADIFNTEATDKIVSDYEDLQSRYLGSLASDIPSISTRDSSPYVFGQVPSTSIPGMGSGPSLYDQLISYGQEYGDTLSQYGIDYLQ